MVAEYLNYPEAAEYAGVSDRTLKRMVAQRSIAHVRLGRRTLFRRTDIDALMSRRLVKAVV